MGKGRSENASAGAGEWFAERLRSLREAAGLTQEELAFRAGLSPSAVGVLERGARRRPYPHTVRAIAETLGLSEEGRASLLATVPKRGGTAASVEVVSYALPELPNPATPLVGREREVEEVAGMLTEKDVRLLTLTGIGGVGKTRLATEVARKAGATFPGGVAFVGLAPLGDPALVLPTIARALGLRESDDRSPEEVLADHLRAKRLLLVLDNFEHLLDAAAGVAGLIETCPFVVVLATSRAPLRVRGEREYPVPPLALPPSTRSPTEDDVLEAPSVRLFLDQARSVSPGFAITRENAAAVAAICWRLAGLPLALELAAAKVRFLEPATLLSRLDRALSVAWSRDLPERQRTMRATLDWSHDLLSNEEHSLFRRLSVFSGGFTLSAAEAVGAIGKVVDEDVLVLLGNLVEQSLVTVNTDEGGEGARYGMLEPVRQYALERLEQSGEAEVTRRRHAAFYLGLAEEGDSELRGPQQVRWLDRLEVEYGNLRAVMFWAVDPEIGDAEIAARLGWSLHPYWWYRGPHIEGRRLVEAVLQRSDLSPTSRAKALVSAGSFAYGHGDYAQSERYCEEGLELSRQVGNKLLSASAGSVLGLVAMSRSDYEAAMSRWEESLRSFREIEEDAGVAQATTVLGMLTLIRGDPDGATPMLEEGLTLAHRIGDTASAYVALYALAQVALSLGNHELAVCMLEEGVTLCEEVRDRAHLALFLEMLSAVEAFRGKAQRSTLLLGAAEALQEEVGGHVHNYLVADTSLSQRAVAEARASLGDTAFNEALVRGRAMTFEQAIEYALLQT
jgi:predicted ATPase/DNA-binding XRE family transcriptional regulator